MRAEESSGVGQLGGVQVAGCVRRGQVRWGILLLEPRSPLLMSGSQPVSLTAVPSREEGRGQRAEGVLMVDG